jgi:hypothetical protein
MVILVLPYTDSVFHFVPEEENTENRALKTMPEFDWSFIDNFPEEFDKYYSDNFDLRNQFLSFNSKLKYQLFNKPPVEGKAFIGYDGWMYLVKDEMDLYYGNTVAKSDELTNYYDIFRYRKNFLDSIGCKYYVVIAPSKASVYPEFLPLSKRKSVEKTLTDQIVSLLDTVTGLTVIDLRTVLKKAKSRDIRMYHKTDNHWNEYGSYVAYEAIMDSLSVDFPNLNPIPISKFNIETVEAKGMGLTNMMGIYDEVYEDKIMCKPDFKRKSKNGEKNNYPVVRGFPYTSQHEIVYTVANDSLPKMLLIRDSFGATLIPFLSEHFSKSVFIFDGWHHWFNEDIVLNEKPDIYIQLVLESFMSNVSIEKKRD